MVPAGPARLYKKVLSGALRVMVNSVSETTSTELIDDSCEALAVVQSVFSRSRLNLTLSAVRGVPLLNVTSGCRVKL